MLKADRINAYAVAPEAMKAMIGVERYVETCGLETDLIELVNIRASQMNGCAYCLDLHSRTARTHGETEQRLYLLSAWHESSLYSERERAALAWTEALTDISRRDVSDDLFGRMNLAFSEREIVNLTTLVGLINAWNRLAISLRYQHSEPIDHES